MSLAVAAVLCAGFMSCGDNDDDEPKNTATENAGGASGNGGCDNRDGAGTVADAVDLGLPSGILWASWNVGATKPEEYGGYYAWGETEEKSNYSWSTYKWSKGSNTTLTKYCTNNSCGTVDDKTVLDPEDDVAHVVWGDGWRMPTYEELVELANNCTWSSMTMHGIYGYKVTSKSNSNSIFLPKAGCRIDDWRDAAGGIRSSSLYSSRYYSYNDYAWSLDVNDYGLPYTSNDCRERGYVVRPVKDK